MAKILEHVIAKWLSIVDCDFSQNAKVADDVLPKKILIVMKLMLVTGLA
jgi:hypothetical protein